MGRKVAVVLHALFSIVAGVLYFFFVLPRWPELMGDTSHTLGAALRIVAGALIALAALPVVFTLLRTRRPEYGTPHLALTLRTTSIVLHVLGGVLIIGAAISELWLNLDSAGQWLFGIYGGAAAIAVLGISACYLAYVAEFPPPPPKPLKPKKPKRRRGRKGASDEAVEDTDDETVDDADDADDAEPTENEDESTTDESTTDDEPAEVVADTSDEAETQAEGGLRNRRPTGKIRTSRRPRRSRGGVAVED